jgi:hypothetical protein
MLCSPPAANQEGANILRGSGGAAGQEYGKMISLKLTRLIEQHSSELIDELVKKLLRHDFKQSAQHLSRRSWLPRRRRRRSSRVIRRIRLSISPPGRNVEASPAVRNPLATLGVNPTTEAIISIPLRRTAGPLVCHIGNSTGSSPFSSTLSLRHFLSPP